MTREEILELEVSCLRERLKAVLGSLSGGVDLAQLNEQIAEKNLLIEDMKIELDWLYQEIERLKRGDGRRSNE